jgi:thiamine transport system substrate-binding protein
MSGSSRRLTVALAGAAAAVLALAGCSGSLGTSSAPQGDHTLVVATHDSWSMPKPLIASFEKKYGVTVRFLKEGDAGELTNKLVLTKGSPLADVAYGIDNTFASRAVKAGIFTPYRPAHEAASVSRFALPAGQGDDRMTPVDYGDVCVNVDDTWFAGHHLAEPRTFDDLLSPNYRNLLVIPGAPTSSTGMAWLAATVGAKGSAWPAYWRKLMANGAKVVNGWEDAYEVDFTAGGGHGDRPIVVSYSSSPPYTIPKGKGRPTTSALLGTCFRQVEYVGVLRGAAHPKAAHEFVDFMQTRAFQAALPENMYVYPVDTSVRLPADWARWAPVTG